MKQRLARLFKPIFPIDRAKLVVFILFILAFCLSFYYCEMFIVIQIEDYFPPRYTEPYEFSFSNASPLAYLTADIILMVFMQIWTGLLISKLRVWLISLPIQYLLCLTVWCLLFFDCAMIGVKLIAQVLVAQIPAVAVGLLIRYLIRKIRAHHQVPAAM